MFWQKEVITRDILQEKQEEVNQLAEEAGQAVDLVNRTINQLEVINQQLDGGMLEIDEYVQSLTAARAAMSKQRSNNAAIIANFSKLLETDDGE